MEKAQPQQQEQDQDQDLHHHHHHLQISDHKDGDDDHLEDGSSSSSEQFQRHDDDDDQEAPTLQQEQVSDTKESARKQQEDEEVPAAISLFTSFDDDINGGCSGRERLQRHRKEVAGQVWIPDIWGQEELLKDWIDCSAFDACLVPSGVISARAALVHQASTTSSSPLRIENSPSSTPGPPS